MSKIKAGDRVAVYGVDGNSEPIRIVTEVMYVCDQGLIHTHEKDTFLLGSRGYDLTIVHPKQCRKLKQRARRRVWLPEIDLTALDDGDDVDCVLVWNRADKGTKLVEFVEVRRKRK